MDENRPPYSLQAPGAAPGAPSYELPGHEPRRRARPPRVDEHHPDVSPEIRRDELIGGRIVQAMPASLPHGGQNFDLDYLVGAHLEAGYRGATDLMTRFDLDHDFASDTAIVKEGVDPATGTRYLEEIAFEVVSEQSEGDVTAKVPRMLHRGVRRVFGVFVKEGSVREWVEKKGKAGWVTLGPEAQIRDRCLAVPLPVAAILDAARRDDAVAGALIAKHNPKIAEHVARGKAEGMAEAIVAILTQRGLEPSDALCHHILACADLETLDRWLSRALVAASADDVIRSI